MFQQKTKQFLYYNLVVYALNLSQRIPLFYLRNIPTTVLSADLWGQIDLWAYSKQTVVDCFLTTDYLAILQTSPAWATFYTFQISEVHLGAK